MLSKKAVCSLLFALICVTVTSLVLWAYPPNTLVANMAMQGNLEELKEQLQAGADVNAAQGDGMTALHWASFKDNIEMADMLIYAGANVNAATRINAMTPLFFAAQNGSSTMLETLMAAGAKVNVSLSVGTTALMLASASGSAASVDVLIENGAELDARETRFGQTALMFASALNRTEAMTALIKGGADPTIWTKVVDVVAKNRRSGRRGAFQGRGGRGRGSSKSPLLSASGIPISNGNIGSVNRQEVLANAAQQQRRTTMGERIPPVQTRGGLTPLLFAARQGHIEAANLLVEAGVDINQQSQGDKTSPLFMAVVNGHFDLARHLLDLGADPSIANSMGGTPLYAAVNVKWAPNAGYPQPDTTQQRITYLELMEAFISNGADVNAKLDRELWFTSYNFDLSRVTAAGATAFWRAAQVSDLAAMKLLISEGADSTIANKDDVTPLHVATGGGVHGNDEVTAPGGWMPAVRYLVDVLGADVNAVDSRGYTPLHNAAAIGHTEMVQFLYDNEADVTVISKSGQTVADMANGPRQRIQPFPETIALLLSMGSPFNDNCVSC